MTLVVNFNAGPGAGKSSTAASVFAELKWRGVNCELVTEFAKDLVWEEHINGLQFQQYIFSQQLHRMERLRGKVDVILTDSPLLFSLVYNPNIPKAFEDYVLYCYESWDNLDIFLKRMKPYHAVGRVQTEEQARELDKRIHDIFMKIKMPLIELKGVKENNVLIANIIEEALKNESKSIS